MRGDATAHVKKCDTCHLHAPIIHSPAEVLHSMSSPLSFHTWGLGLLGPFDLALGQLKQLLVAVDYFTNWIKSQPSSTITSAHAQNFVLRNIFCHFGIPTTMVTDHRTQLTDKGFWEMLVGLQIKHHFASVAHSQSIGQAEVVNWVIFVRLRKRCQDSCCHWVENLFQVLWGHHTTIHSSTGETPFK
jgi:hypothetical protein